MPAPLQLRLTPATAPRPAVAAAGFLPGSDVGAWLEEMARHPRARFFIVPASAEEPDAGGLLIVNRDAGAGLAATGPRVLPAAVEHGCVVVPGGMQMDPQLTPEEARKLLAYPLYFFHPAIGLVAFEEQDAITAGMLIVPPLVRPVSWLRAMPGRNPPPHLGRVSLAVPTDPDDLFGDAAADIGSASPQDLQKQAPLGERIRDKIRGGLAPVAAGFLRGLMSMLGRGGKSSGAGGSAGAGGGGGSQMFEKLARWTADQLEKLQQQRESEINRLLKLLETNPEEGLRYALPFNSGGGARGTAPPSGRLSLNNPVYGGRRGTGPADTWNLSERTQWELQKRYRDLANRELAEGRFDRAAYIFAELLGDWHSAAAALTRGHRYQEAARIYLDKLGNKVQAAQCLENGGLLNDAVLLYAELGRHEKCGDLLRRLGLEDEAVAAYRRALEGNGCRLDDARILFDKLRQPGLALAVLASGYPISSQARACLEKHFEYLAQMGAREDAVALAAGLADVKRQMQPPLAMVETLDSIRRKEPDGEVQELLSAAALGVIGNALAGAAGVEGKQQLLDLLPRFAPADVVLRRDSHRYLDEQRRQAALRRKPVRPGQPVRRTLFHLPQEVRAWHTLLSRGEIWLAAGHQRSTSQDVWVMGSGEHAVGKMTSAAGWKANLALPPHLTPLPATAWLPMAQAEQPARYAQAKAADFTSPPRTRDTLISRLNWMPPHLLAVHPAEAGAWVLHCAASGTVDLSFYTYEGSLLRTHALGWQPPDLPASLQMVSHGEEIFIAAGPQIIQVKNGKVVNQTQLSIAVHRLTASRREHPAAFIAVAGREAVLFTPGKKGDTVQLFSGHAGDNPPAACFLADGRIAVADRTGGLIYSAAPDTRLLHPVNLPKNQNCEVTDCAAWGDSGLAILWQDGLVECYE